MSVSGSLQRLVGHWAGDNSLWLAPGEPVRTSAAAATIALEAMGQCLSIRYTWADDGKPQAGVLLLSGDAKTAALAAAWTDSWHYAHQLMPCVGALDATGLACVRGSYAAPPGPDWGWRLTVAPPANDRFTLRMYNITAEGEEMLAVEANFARTAG